MQSILCRFYFLLALLKLFPLAAFSQISGCTDPLATNYNAAATVNNGLCSYTPSSYSPPVKVDPITDSLIETSGLQIAGNALWSFNDRGGKPSLYRIDTATNALLQRVILAGATNEDWEDIAFDGTSLYIGDFGNNRNGARTDLKIYKFPFSAIHDYHSHPADTIAAEQIEVINFSYSDQPQPPLSSGPNHTRFDCEAMIVDNGKIHLFTKNWIDLTTTHYIINNIAAGNYIANRVDSLATNYLVTAADKVAGQNIIVLLGYQNSGTARHFLYILSDYKTDSFFSGNKRRIDLPDVTVMGQAEGITFKNDRYGYISNEKFDTAFGPIRITVNQKLRSFDISSFVSVSHTIYTFTGNGNWSTAVNWNNNSIPPANPGSGAEIFIDPVAGGQCLLDIDYRLLSGAKLTVNAGKNFLIQGSLTVQQ